MKFFSNMRAMALALTGLTALTGVAFALSGTANTQYSARQNTSQQTNYFRFKLNYNDPNISTGVKFGRLPSNAFIVGLKCHVTNAFNAGSTNVVTVGTTVSNANVIAAADLNEASVAFQNLSSGAGLGLSTTTSGEVDLFAKYTQSGTGASAGSTVCVIEYVPDNDK